MQYIIIPEGKYNALKSFKQDVDKILKKLEKKEFAVAIVGLENAGKSTLGNVLMGLRILPDSTVRCTFTTTELRASQDNNDNKGIVEFYNTENFDSDVFQPKLASIQFPNPEPFQNFNLYKLQNWWGTLTDAQKNGNQDNYDILVSMITNRDTLNEYFTLGTQPLDLSDSADFQTLKNYITGTNGTNITPSLAIKKITIYSAQLQQLQEANIVPNNNVSPNIVVYDVPGFNSPHIAHKEETLKMLNEADAIILVANVAENPNITDTQKNILVRDDGQNRIDLYGIPINKKTFVFGNKLDNATDPERNKTTLQNEVFVRYPIVSIPDRIFFGSAGKVQYDADGRAVTTDAGVEDLRQSIQSYYQSNRFEAIQAHYEKKLKEINGILKEIDTQSVPTEGIRYYLEAFNNLKEKFQPVLENIKNECTEGLNSEPFTSLIVSEDRLNKILPEQNVDSEILNEIRAKLQSLAIDATDVTRIDLKLRERLKLQFQENIIEVAKEVKFKEQDFYNKLYERFLKFLGMELGATNKKELTDRVSKLFDGILSKNGGQYSPNSAIENTFEFLLEVIIYTSFNSDGRKEFVKKEFIKLSTLSTYYANHHISEENLNTRQKDFFSRILLHKDALTDNYNQQIPNTKVQDNNFQVLLQFVQNRIGSIMNNQQTETLIRELADILSTQYNIHLQNENDIPNREFNNWLELLSKNNASAEEFLIFFNIPSQQQNNWLSDVLTFETVEQMINAAPILNRMTDENEMIKILNEDIRNLRLFVKEAVVHEIGLERAFRSTISKNINLIKEAIKDGEIFIDWLEKNYREVNKSQFNNLDNLKRINELKLMLSKDVQSILLA